MAAAFYTEPVLTFDLDVFEVLRVEHLIAISIQTGREKDRERVRLLREVPELDPGYLADILDRHKLERNWLP